VQQALDLRLAAAFGKVDDGVELVEQAGVGSGQGAEPGVDLVELLRRQRQTSGLDIREVLFGVGEAFDAVLGHLAGDLDGEADAGDPIGDLFHGDANEAAQELLFLAHPAANPVDDGPTHAHSPGR
jgi:hypothetical protein